MLLFLLSPAASLASEPLCSEVRERSGGRIQCSKNANIWTLDYGSAFTHYLVRASGQYKELITTLCGQGDAVIEIIGRQVRTIQCAPRNSAK